MSYANPESISNDQLLDDERTFRAFLSFFLSRPPCFYRVFPVSTRSIFSTISNNFNFKPPASRLWQSSTSSESFHVASTRNESIATNDELPNGYRVNPDFCLFLFCFVFITRLGFFPFCFQRHRWNVLDVLPGKK